MQKSALRKQIGAFFLMPFALPFIMTVPVGLVLTAAMPWVLQQILFAHFDERMARFLLNEYGKTGTKKIRMTQELIAKEVNSAREVVARMLRQFADEGWIEVERGAINIKDLDALRKLAE